MFIDYLRLGTYKIIPLPNSISDHDAQLILIHDIILPIPPKGCWITRKFDKGSLADFNYKLSSEIWNDVFEENDVNVMFNSFLNIFLRHFYASFPKAYIKSFTPIKKLWISPSINIKLTYLCTELSPS
jgi:hypothetical protein